MATKQDKNPLNIYQRHLAIMEDIRYIQKESLKVNGQYTYVSHDAVTAAIHPHLVKHGVAIIPSVVDIEKDSIVYNKWNKYTKIHEESFGYMVIVKLKLTFINTDDPTDFFEVFYNGQGLDATDKAIGKAVSYAYKYALLKTFCLETGDDPEEDADSTLKKPPKEDKKPEPVSSPKTLSKEQINGISNALKDDKDTAWMKERLLKLNVSNIKDIPQSDYMRLNNDFADYLLKKGE